MNKLTHKEILSLYQQGDYEAIIDHYRETAESKNLPTIYETQIMLELIDNNDDGTGYVRFRAEGVSLNVFETIAQSGKFRADDEYSMIYHNGKVDSRLGGWVLKTYNTKELAEEIIKNINLWELV
jgi:hypothetical protein